MTPKRKRKEKILIDEDFETEEENDVDVALEEAINRAIRTKEARKSLGELITNITADQPAATTFTNHCKENSHKVFYPNFKGIQ